MAKNFVILIGGPSQYNGCDPAHDKTWNNYFGLMLRATEQGSGKGEADETVHWLVFAPPYRERWDADDATFPALKQFFSFRRELYDTRDAHAENVKSAGSKNYLDLIRAKATGFKFTVKELETPAAFWDYLRSLPDRSVSRVWYSGHAYPGGLMVSLQHNSACAAVSKDIITNESIVANAALATKFASPARQSQFFGCNTADFAAAWNRVFGVPAAGADGAITFTVLQKSGDVLTNAKSTPATQTSTLSWKEY